MDRLSPSTSIRFVRMMCSKRIVYGIALYVKRVMDGETGIVVDAISVSQKLRSIYVVFQEQLLRKPQINPVNFLPNLRDFVSRMTSINHVSGFTEFTIYC